MSKKIVIGLCIILLVFFSTRVSIEKHSEKNELADFLNKNIKSSIETREKIITPMTLKQNRVEKVGDTYEVEALTDSGPVSKIKIMGIENPDDFSKIRLAEIEDGKNTDFAQVYAIDPTKVSFTEATVTVKASANATELYKCKSWNFTTQECVITETCWNESGDTICNYTGGWEFLMNVTPGEEYTFTLTPEDPGFGEGTTHNFENFQSYSDGDTTLASSIWNNVAGDTCQWYTDKAGTPSGSTGPDIDHTLGTTSGEYLFVETSSGYCYTAGNTALLETDELDANTYAYNLSFWYHMYGRNIGTLNVDVYNGTWYNGIWSKTGQQHTSSTQAYTQAKVDLTNYTGTIKIRFKYVAAGNYRGDAAVDDINITKFARITYGTLNVTLNTPTPETTTNVTQNQTFWVNATVYCSGEANLTCGNVTAYARYNASVAGWWNTSFNKRKEINITNAGPTTLSNFPAYLNISKESSMQPNYDDLRFINGSCNSGQSIELPYEIENYTATNAHGWVKILSLGAGVNSICMYYGGSVSSGENITRVWDSNYVMVQHLQESSGSGNYSLDSTSNDNDGSPLGNASGTPTYSSNAKIDGGWEFSGNNKERIEIPDDSSLQTVNSLTAEGWAKADSWLTPDHDPVIWKGSQIGWGGNYLFRIAVSSGVPTWGITCGATEGWFTGGTVSTGQWYYYALTFDGTTTKAYIDGVEVANNTGCSGQTLNAMAGYPIRSGFGYRSTVSEETHFDGTVDELRLSNTPRTADWINQTYQMVANQDSFVTSGGEESSSSGKEAMTAINITTEATPFYTTSSQPQSCLLNQGQSCKFNWSVNATGAIDDYYKINVNFSSDNSWVIANETNNATVRIVSEAGEPPDTIPPASVTNLQNQSAGTTWIYWNWTNPGDADFSQAIIYINGFNILNTSNNYYNATGLAPNTNYTITVHTKDTSNNVNNTDVNNTASTLEEFVEQGEGIIMEWIDPDMDEIYSGDSDITDVNDENEEINFIDSFWSGILSIFG